MEVPLRVHVPTLALAGVEAVDRDFTPPIASALVGRHGVQDGSHIQQSGAQMDTSGYVTGIGELYAAEVLGEGLANRWLQLATDPDQKYKLGLFLQLESEAKVRLRPLLARHGISLVEDARLKSDGATEAEQFAAQPWKEAMATLAKLALPYAHRFQSLLDAAPPEDIPLIRFMVDHELSVVRIAERESKGESAMDTELVVKLAHPIARRS